MSKSKIYFATAHCSCTKSYDSRLYLLEREIKKLTDEMQNEFNAIAKRVDALCVQYLGNVSTDQFFYMLSRLNSQHGYELETYKVKLENFYSETDVKEQTFQDL